jgi:hypothetical protein
MQIMHTFHIENEKGYLKFKSFTMHLEIIACNYKLRPLGPAWVVKLISKCLLL